MKILNITADYPDEFNKNKTPAVRLLLDASKHEHHVISINRVSFPSSTSMSYNDGVWTVRYFAPPYGIMLRFFLKKLSLEIFDKIKNERYDCIVAHKFTIEGVIAFYLSKQLGVEYYCALWGSTDKKYLRHKPELKSYYRTVFNKAKGIMPATPWIKEYVDDFLGVSHSNNKLVPIITSNTRFFFTPYESKCARFVTVFNLNIFNLKGLPNLLKALSRLPKDREWTLDIIGRGTHDSVHRITTLIRSHGLENQVFIVGPVENEVIIEKLGTYHSFLMPTTSETFGMVFIESLFASIPILYSKGQGVDGLFNDVYVGYRVDPLDVNSILAGIIHLLDNRSLIVDGIVESHRNGLFNFLTKDCIVNEFDSYLACGR